MDRRTLRRPSGIAASPGSVVVALQSPRNSTSGFTRSLICTPRQLLRVHGLSLALAPLPTRYMPAMLSLMITRSLLPFTRSRQHSGTRSESAGRRADPLYASRARGVGGLARTATGSTWCRPTIRRVATRRRWGAIRSAGVPRLTQIYLTNHSLQKAVVRGILVLVQIAAK